MNIKKGDKFQHFKGFIIEIKDIAKNTENLEDMVIYEHDNTLWARPLDMFLSSEDVSKRPDNVTGQKRRFERIDE